MKTSPAQTRVLRAIRAGKLVVAQTGTRDGNVVAGLVVLGLVSASTRVFVRSETTHWGRKIPSCTVYGGLIAA